MTAPLNPAPENLPPYTPCKGRIMLYMEISPEVADRSIFDDSTYAEAVEALLGNHAANEE